jgi:hypothetical protein
MNIPTRAGWLIAAAIVLAASASINARLLRAAEAAPDAAAEAGAVFDKLDANHDGQLTADEIPEAKRGLFSRLLRLAGKPADGKLSRDEFVAQLKSLDQPAASDSPASQSATNNSPSKPAQPAKPVEEQPKINPERLFNRLDAKGAGKLSLSDVPLGRQQLFKRLLTIAGKPESGSLTKAEFIKAVDELMAKREGNAKPAETKTSSANSPSTPGTTAKPAVAADGNFDVDQAVKRIVGRSSRSDGKLTKNELPERLQDRFDKIDANQDGLVDADELRAWLTKAKQRVQAANNK